jgi:uncharacterized protein YdhG (YjbR/CyaY superfamily)
MKKQDGQAGEENPAEGEGFLIDEYIGRFPEAVQEKLETIRRIIAGAAPGAREVISYGMPAFRLGETLVYFAAFARHIGFYPTSGPIAAFQEELKPYKTSKGAVQFPLDRELPENLIACMTEFRVEEVLAKAASREEAARSVAARSATAPGTVGGKARKAPIEGKKA